MKKRRSVSRWSRPFTVVAAMLITVASVWLLGVLNVRATSGLQPRSSMRTVVMRGPETAVLKQEKQQEQTKPEEPEEEIMEVRLDMPLEPIALEPLELDTTLPSPTIPPIDFASPASSQSVSSATQAKTAESKAHSASNVDLPPRERGSNSRPPYPAAKLQSSVEGSVAVKLLINEEGEVADVKVVSGDPEFVKAVMAVVFDWRFIPAQNRGKPVKVWGLKRVNFRLR